MKMMHVPNEKLLNIGKYFVIFILGLVVGGYLFSETQPRSIINLSKCNNECYKPKDLVGLLTSIGITKLNGKVPNVVLETEKSIVIKHPMPEARIHYVVFPKKDIKNAGEFSKENAPYFEDAYLVMATLIKKEKLTDYRIITNGPGFQDTTYLHFHLRAN